MRDYITPYIELMPLSTADGILNASGETDGADNNDLPILWVGNLPE